MRHLKTTLILTASLALTVVLSLAGCGDDHGNRFRGDRDDRSPSRYDRQDNDRHEVRQESDRHEDRGGNSNHESEHGDR